ncbi:MAG TPA: GAF domain-containing protein [Mycobacteriales bacterium]|nr:GAF domain-containing protein [Mycobacteriales bacterium]HWC34165.1 GAF domain-containing protein [Mycobacteriales bacterium]
MVDEPASMPSLGQLELSSLLREVVDRVESVSLLADRLQALLQAVVAIGSQLDLPSVLLRIAETAAELSDAQYAALGVLDPSGNQLSQFITVGINDEDREKIGDLPHGRGVLGLLIDEPRALRLANIADHERSFGFPPNHPPMRTFLGVPINIRGEAFGNLYLTEKRGGGAFTREDEQIVLALASAAGLAVQNARLYEHSRQREQWLEASNGITTSLLSGATGPDVFPALVAAARRLSDADLALLLLPADTASMRVAAVDGHHADDLQDRVLSKPQIAMEAMATGAPIAVADARNDSRVVAELRDAGIGAALYVPLGAADEALGTLIVGRLGDRAEFGEDVLQLVESFAGQAALTLRLGTAAADREQLAVLGDRDRIARDLHDLVIQRLFATGMSLEGSLRGMPPEKVERVQKAVSDLDETIREIRSTIFALQSPAPIAGDGVRGAVLALTHAYSTTLGFEPSVTFSGPVDTVISAGIGEHLLAVLRELLSNAAKHAHASAISVELEADADAAELRVRDNGVGIPEETHRSGLANMASRADGLNGKFQVSAGEVGTIAIWRVPLPA